MNRRQSRTLEAMARAIFQSWFVDFDPVHENARRGLDWEAHLRQRANEPALASALGLTPPQAPPTTNPEEEPDDAVATPDD